MKFKAFSISAIFVSLLFVLACNSKTEKPVNNLGFSKVNGIRFYEVKRRFSSGLSFNEDGFQQEPAWIIEFKAPDTMLAYSPEKRGMESFFLQYDHGTVYNFAREYFRANVISKDSLVLQRLEVNGRVIAKDMRSDVNCTFYAKDYIENKLHTTIGELQETTHADTLFIKKLTERANRHPSNPDSAFAARQPVVFIPKSKFVTAKKISTVDYLNHRSRSYDYMYPAYDIVILRSYKEFAYRFSVIVDAKGKMYVNRVEGVMPDDIPFRKKLLQGITDVYLHNLLKIVPGTTLGIPHASEVTLNVVGKKIP